MVLIKSLFCDFMSDGLRLDPSWSLGFSRAGLWELSHVSAHLPLI